MAGKNFLPFYTGFYNVVFLRGCPQNFSFRKKEGMEKNREGPSLGKNPVGFLLKT